MMAQRLPPGARHLNELEITNILAEAFHEAMQECAEEGKFADPDVIIRGTISWVVIHAARTIRTLGGNEADGRRALLQVREAVNIAVDCYLSDHLEEEFKE